MEKVYASPFRVYLFLALLAGVGIYSGAKLPVHLQLLLWEGFRANEFAPCHRQTAQNAESKSASPDVDPAIA